MDLACEKCSHREPELPASHRAGSYGGLSADRELFLRAFFRLHNRHVQDSDDMGDARSVLPLSF